VVVWKNHTKSYHNPQLNKQKWERLASKDCELLCDNHHYLLILYRAHHRSSFPIPPVPDNSLEPTPFRLLQLRHPMDRPNIPQKQFKIPAINLVTKLAIHGAILHFTRILPGCRYLLFAPKLFFLLSLPSNPLYHPINHPGDNWQDCHVYSIWNEWKLSHRFEWEGADKLEYRGEVDADI